MLAWILVASIATPPSSSAVEQLNEAVELYHRGDVDRARNQLQRVARENPRYGHAHLTLGRLYQKMGHWAPARVAYEAALEVATPEQVAKYALSLGKATAALADDPGFSTDDANQLRRDAIAAFERAIEADAFLYQAHARKAKVHVELEQPTRADRAFRKCIEIEPRYAPCFIGLGQLYIEYGHPEEGISVLTAGTQTAETSATMWLGLANGLRAIGRARDAVDAYGKALTLAPHRPDINFGLGMTYADLGMRKEAVESLERFLERADDSVPEHFIRAAANEIARMQDVI